MVVLFIHSFVFIDRTLKMLSPKSHEEPGDHLRCYLFPEVLITAEHLNWGIGDLTEFMM